MSMFDWVASGLTHYGVETPGFSGSYGTTLGDAVAGFFGSRHAHIFGPDIKLVCDPEDMLLGKLEHALPLFTALLGGIGGNVTFCYGSNTTATYVGPKMEIRRAPSITKTSDNVLAMMKVGNNDVVDMATSLAAAALSILICATAAAFELAIHFIYPKFGSSAAADHESIEHYGALPETLKLCVVTITTRLMALLKLLEDKGTWANFAKQFGKEAAANLLLANVLIGVFCPIALIGVIFVGGVGLLIQYAVESADQVAAAH